MPVRNYSESKHFSGFRAGTDLEAALLVLKQQAGEASIASLSIETKTKVLTETWLKGEPRVFQGGLTVIAYMEHLDPILGHEVLDELKAQRLLSFII